MERAVIKAHPRRPVDVTGDHRDPFLRARDRNRSRDVIQPKIPKESWRHQQGQALARHDRRGSDEADVYGVVHTLDRLSLSEAAPSDKHG